MFSVRCEKCNTETVMSSYTLSTVELEGLEVDYIECPQCHARYVYLLKDKQQKALIKELRDLNHRVELKNRLNKPVSPGLLRQLKKAFDASKRHQKLLRAEHMTAVTEQLNNSDFSETNS